ncbi:uncharacterized protein LOC116348533 [Contarinia nasturtii]|uniref:uncharacterized protein LOC116348533 n=1 Tax=Contarinia nasturtii TaxID=265458 RepID=UPI0012D4B3E7|nr:uncharacterized protein LOC116348533 [Contarinia nasturtii]
MLEKCSIIYLVVLLLHIADAENFFECNRGCNDGNVCHYIKPTEPNLKRNFPERTLILLKRDAVERKLVGKIIERFENKGLKLVGMKMQLPTKEMVKQHYIEHKDESFFDDLIEFMTSAPLISMIWEGPNVIKITRNMLGVHDPITALSGTIRGDFSTNVLNNVAHGSDSIEAANKEMNLWFQANDIMS